MLPTNIDEWMDRFPPIGSDVPPKRIKYSKRKAIASRLRAFIRSLSCMWACHHLLSPPSETPRILLTSTGNIPFGFQSGLLDFSLVPDIFTSMSLFSAFSFRTVLRCVSSGTSNGNQGTICTTCDDDILIKIPHSRLWSFSEKYAA